jgi:hypothetical protein
MSAKKKNTWIAVIEYFTNWRRESVGVKVTDFPCPQDSSPFALGRCMDSILEVKTAYWWRIHLPMAIEGRSSSRNWKCNISSTWPCVTKQIKRWEQKQKMQAISAIWRNSRQLYQPVPYWQKNRMQNDITGCVC